MVGLTIRARVVEIYWKTKRLGTAACWTVGDLLHLLRGWMQLWRLVADEGAAQYSVDLDPIVILN